MYLLRPSIHIFNDKYKLNKHNFIDFFMFVANFTFLLQPPSFEFENLSQELLEHEDYLLGRDNNEPTSGNGNEKSNRRIQ